MGGGVIAFINDVVFYIVSSLCCYIYCDSTKYEYFYRMHVFTRCRKTVCRFTLITYGVSLSLQCQLLHDKLSDRHDNAHIYIYIALFF